MVEEVSIDCQGGLIREVVVTEVDLVDASIVPDRLTEFHSTFVVEIVLAKVNLLEASLGLLD